MKLSLAGCVALIGIGLWLEPAEAGIGTHQQLGLPACTFLKLTGYPCPSCGLTTSFTHAVHLDFGRALAVQPFGLVFFLAVIAWIPTSTVLIARGRKWNEIIESRRMTPILGALTLLYLAGWFWKLATFAQ